MSVHTPQLAPIVVLAFLGTAFLVMVSLLIGLVGVLRKSQPIAFGGIAAATVVSLGYGSVLVGLSLLSRDVELPQGAWKYFCEIDCPIANSVVRVQVMNPFHEELQAEPGNGKIVVVQLKTWFDPSTISPHRGNGPLMPGHRKVWLIDGKGRRFAESPKRDTLLTRDRLHSTPLHTALRPGESYDSYLVFETPLDSHDLRLLVTSTEDLDSAIWGHEISPFHGKAYFGIRGPASAHIANL
jgi:hypothetical protein